MTGVMDLKHILCEPMEVKTTKTTMIMHPLDYYDEMQQHHHQRQYHPETDNLNHPQYNSIHITHGTNLTCHHVSPRQRVRSEHHRTSPVLSREYHYSQHLHPHYHRDEVLIAPLTSSMSTNMIPSHSSSSSIYSATPSMTSSLSPSTSSSASSLSSSSSSPITPTLPTPTSTSTTLHDRQHHHHHHHHQRRRHRSASTSQVHHHYQAQRHIPDTTTPIVNQTQTRTPWTPHEDDLLQKGYEEGLSWAMISSTYLPHRSRGCCWGRFKTLQNKNLIDVKVQQQIRSAKLAWKTMEISTSPSSISTRLSSSSPSQSSLST